MTVYDAPSKNYLYLLFLLIIPLGIVIWWKVKTKEVRGKRYVVRKDQRGIRRRKTLRGNRIKSLNIDTMYALSKK